MKVLIGKREGTPNPGLREGQALLAQFVPAMTPSPKRVFLRSCGRCDQEVKVSMTEDIKTNEIWIEGPDACPSCGHRLAAVVAPSVSLSQEQIIALFGPVLS